MKGDPPPRVVEQEHIVAMCRLLVNSGDLTPMGQRLILRLWQDKPSEEIAEIQAIAEQLRRLGYEVTFPGR